MEMFGFASQSELRSFKMLIGVSGVGPKAALSILSSTTPQQLSMAVVMGDEKALTAAPGIGKKIAQRIILELKDKLIKEQGGFEAGSGAAAAMPAQNNKAGEATAALAVLGYGSGDRRRPEGHRHGRAAVGGDHPAVAEENGKVGEGTA